MKSLYESILNSTNSGKYSDSAFFDTFEKAFHDCFSDYVMERIIRKHPVGNLNRILHRIEIPLDKTHAIKFCSIFHKQVDKFVEMMKDYSLYGSLIEDNLISDPDEQFVYRYIFNIQKTSPMWKNRNYFYIGIAKYVSKEEPEYLIIDDLDGNFEKFFDNKKRK